MKKILIAFTALTLCFFSCKQKEKQMSEETTIKTDTTATEESEMAEEPMDSVAMQKAWEAYMTPGEAHKRMAADEGKWNDEITFWMGSDAPPQKTQGTEEIKMIMGGRYQVSNFSGEMMGQPFEGRSTLAYDNATNEYISTWIDNMGTGLSVTRGKYNEETKSSIMTGSMIDPMTGKEKQTREIFTIVDDNTRKLEMFETAADGKERKTMEMVMKKT